MSKHVVYSISSVLIGAALYHAIMLRGRWCPIGRVIAHVLLLLARMYSGTSVDRTQTARQDKQGEMFRQHHESTQRRPGTRQVNPLTSAWFAMNVTYVCSWLYCDYYDRVTGDEFGLLVMSMVAASTRKTKILCGLMCALSMYRHGVPTLMDMPFAMCMFLCMWLMRNPSLSTWCNVIFVAFWIAVAARDADITCNAVWAAIPQLVFLYVPIVYFNARPISLILLICAMDVA